MALCNLVPTYFCPIPPFYSPLLCRLLQGVGAHKSGSLAPGCFACSEQNGWTAARVCSLSGNMVERLRPAGSSRSAQPFVSHFISERDTESLAFSDCSQALAFSCFFVQFFFSNSLSQKPHVSPLFWGIFSLYAHISFVLFERGGLKPSIHEHTHTLVKENKHARPAECV